jgi:ornithine carbamoyltransferase
MRALKGRSLLNFRDYKRDEVDYLLNLSLNFKFMIKSGFSTPKTLRGKNILLIFEKPSTRTRVSMEVAIRKLGGNPIISRVDELQLGRGEPVSDTGKVLGRYVDAIAARVNKHESLLELQRSSGIPIINMLSDKAHPLQALADFMTILEKFNKIDKIKIAFVGDGSDNVLSSLIELASYYNVRFSVASPKDLRPEEEVLRYALKNAENSGFEIEFFEDPRDAVKGANVVYTDVWLSMGQENMIEKKKKLSIYRVTKELMLYSAGNSIFMHCLPAKRGEEVDSEVIDGDRSVVWDQAENRLYTSMAVLSSLV